MGHTTAVAISELDIDLKQQIEIHLVSNFYPPIPRFMAQICVDALNAYWEKDTNRMINMPKGVLYRGSTSAPAWAVVEQHRLSPWLNKEEDYDSE
jgi:hypothetical protein